MCGLGRAGWVGVPPPSRKALARRGALAAKQILFQTSPLAPEGLGNSGPCHREARGAAGAPPGCPLPTRAGRGSRCRRTPWLCGRASCPALLSGPQAGERQERERDRGQGMGRGDAQGRSKKEGGRGPGPRGPLQHRAGGQRPPAPSARPAGAGEGQAGQGAAWSGVRAGAWVTFPGPGCGWAGGQSVAERARSGPVHVAPRELRWRLKGTARRARHMEAHPAPRPRPSVTTRAGPQRRGGRPRGTGAGATEPRPLLHSQTLPPRRIRWDLGAGACNPRPPSGVESQTLLPPTSDLLGVDPGGGRPPRRQGPAPPRPRPCGAPCERRWDPYVRDPLWQKLFLLRPEGRGLGLGGRGSPPHSTPPGRAGEGVPIA